MPSKDTQDATPGVTGETSSKEVKVQVEIEPADEAVYSNVASLSLSPFDVRVNFALMNLTHPGKTVVKAHTAVIMSPEQAASLSLLLLKQVFGFESQFGPVRLRAWHQFREQLAPIIKAQPNDDEE